MTRKNETPWALCAECDKPMQGVIPAPPEKQVREHCQNCEPKFKGKKK